MKACSKGHRRQEGTPKRQKKHKHKTNKSKTEETNKDNHIIRVGQEKYTCQQATQERESYTQS